MPYSIRNAVFFILEYTMGSPCYSYVKVEEPCDGYDRGSYVAITVYK